MVPKPEPPPWHTIATTPKLRTAHYPQQQQGLKAHMSCSECPDSFSNIFHPSTKGRSSTWHNFMCPQCLYKTSRIDEGCSQPSFLTSASSQTLAAKLKPIDRHGRALELWIIPQQLKRSAAHLHHESYSWTSTLLDSYVRLLYVDHKQVCCRKL